MALAHSFNYFLNDALKPLKRFLEEDNVIEICVNKPGSVFIERQGSHGSFEHYEIEELTKENIQNIAERVAGLNNQHVNAENPLLSAALPTGERIQIVLPPVAPEGGSITIRKQIVQNLVLQDYFDKGSFDNTFISKGTLTEIEKRLVSLLSANNPHDLMEFISLAVRSRVSIVLSGGTGSGKTTFLNTLLKEIPEQDRLITIEDTRELYPQQKNTVSLLISRNDQGLAKVDATRLLESCLRMRPDRILMGELRGKEAFAFIRAINTGHPGSLTTVHANSPRGAYEQLALMVLQGETELTKEHVMDYLHSVIPLVIQIGKNPKTGEAGYINEIYYAPLIEGN